MASNPVKRAMISSLAAQANPDTLALPPNHTEEDAAFAYLLAYTENGGRLSKLADTLGISRFLLDRWIKGTPERAQEFSRARVVGADALVDEGGDLLDKADRDTIAVANARAGWRKWLASKYDPATYGDKQPGGIAIGALHLHAALPLAPLSVPTPLIAQSPPLNGSPDSDRVGGYPTEGKPYQIESKAGEIVVDPPRLVSGQEGDV